MSRFSRPKLWNLRFVLGLSVTLAVLLACDINVNTDEGANANDLAATQNALQATQIALEVQKQQQDQQLQQPVQDPQTQQEQVPQQSQPTLTLQPDIVYEGISFSFDHAIASGVNPENVPGQQGQEGPPGGNYPDHIVFSFNGYVLADCFHDPKIYIYPVADYEAIEPIAFERVETLKSFMVNKPVVTDDTLPFMPIWPAAQMMHAKAEYFEFQNGSGMRFLSQYGQAANPINNKEMFYTYQGLTQDGAYYVAAVLPVSHPGMVADASIIPNNDWAAFSDNYLNYAAETQQTLNAQPDSSFTPSLEVLDAIFRSLRVK